MATGDLCTIEDVLLEGDMNQEEAGADYNTIFPSYITAFSASLESYCSFSFTRETRTDEVFSAPRLMVGPEGHLYVWTKKSNIVSVNSVYWRSSPRAEFQAIPQQDILIYPSDDGKIDEYGGLIRIMGDWLSFRTAPDSGLLQAKATYIGGFDPTPPALVKACAKLVWWAYKQRDTVPTGKTAIPNLGVLIIPDAWPASVLSFLWPYKNVRL